MRYLESGKASNKQHPYYSPKIYVMQKLSTLLLGNHNRMAGIGLIGFLLLMISSCTKKEVTPIPESVPDMYYSDWTPASFTRFIYTDDYGYNDTAYTYQITSADITQDVLDHGALLVYIKYNGVATPYALPYVDPYSNLTWWIESQVNSLNVNYAFGPAYNGIDPGAYNNGDVLVRFIVLTKGVPALEANRNKPLSEPLAGIPGRSYRQQPANPFAGMSYSEVCRQLGIPE